MRTKKLVVVMPVGPNLRYDFVLDTVDSIKRYATGSCQIVIVDDSGAGVGARLLQDEPSVDVIVTEGAQGLYGGLYVGTSLAFAHVLANYDFSVLLRLDTDALVIGSDAEDQAIRYFADHPDVGMLGSYRFGCDGVRRDFTPARRLLKKEIAISSLLLAPQRFKRFWFLRANVARAVANGYELGEHCLASAVFFSSACVRALAAEKLLNRSELQTSRLGDDHLFGLLTVAAGFKIADFATHDLPIGVRWRGLPFAPQELLDRKKRLIHSTRFWNDMNEEQIRDFFRVIRAAT